MPLNMKKARFFLFFLIFCQKLPKNGHFFHIRFSIFFSYTPSLSVTYFFTVVDCFIRFKMFDYALKYEKSSFFLFFLIFCQKLPKNGHFFHFRWSIFFSYTPSLSVTYFFTVLDCFIRFFKCSIMLLNVKKARFFIFLDFLLIKFPKNGNFFHFRWSIFFSYTP